MSPSVPADTAPVTARLRRARFGVFGIFFVVGLGMAAWLVSVVLFSLGWILFGLASWRARVLPRALSVAVALGGLIGFQAAMPPWGVVLGLAVAAVGVWLIRQDQMVR